MNLRLFLSRKYIVDHGWGNFYLFIVLICITRLNCWLLIRKMRFYFFENLFRVICLCLLIIFFLLFVVLFECIQLFVYVELLQDRIFGRLFDNCVKRVFVYFLNF